MCTRLREELGVATVEWLGLVLLVSGAFGSALGVAPAIDGRSFGGFLAHRITCTLSADCDTGDAELASAYGSSDAELLRRYAPSLTYEVGERSLPIDFRECRVRACSRVADSLGLDTHTSDAGNPATAFTRVVHRGGYTYLQYWLYYPYSNTTIGNPREGVGSLRLPLDEKRSASGAVGGLTAAAAAGKLTPWAVVDRARSLRTPRAPRPRVSQAPKWWDSLPLPVRAVAWQLTDGKTDYPGFHYDDWEGVQVRLDPAGRASMRATSHGHYQWCKQADCKNEWGTAAGWSRVSYGSHAGHIPTVETESGARVPERPGAGASERTTTSGALHLVPLETVDRDSYIRRDGGISPPWQKEVYDEPESDES